MNTTSNTPHPLRLIPLLAGLVPVAAIVAAYTLSAALSLVPWCVPPLEGCTSISRAARNEPVIMIFRALMLPSAALIGIYWLLSAEWLRSLGDRGAGALWCIRILGIIGAIFLIVYVSYLGTTGDVYRLMRRYGVVVYFSCTAFAQLLLVSRLYKIPAEVVSPQLAQIRRLMFILCSGLIIIAFANVAEALGSFDSDSVENVIEWLFAALMHLFFLLSADAWTISGFRVDFKTR